MSAAKRGVMLFNPFNGTPRHPSDIASDPTGILVWDGEEPLRAAAPAAVEALSESAEFLSALARALRSSDRDGPAWWPGTAYANALAGQCELRAAAILATTKGTT